jgi:hypothetical protein
MDAQDIDASPLLDVGIVDRQSTAPHKLDTFSEKATEK